MEHFGLSTGFVLVQICNLGLLIGWPVLSILALLKLKERKLSQTVQALWVLIVVAVPYLGALAYWLVDPQGSDDATA